MDNVFMNRISKNYNSIKESFRNRLKRLGLSFDEDIFSDTLIKCNNRIADENTSYKDMIAYFWMAFKINTLREFDYSRNKHTVKVFPTNLIFEYEEANDGFEKVSRLIIDKFGDDLYRLFVLHSNGATYEELYELTNTKDLKYKFRCIREYIRKQYA